MKTGEHIPTALFEWVKHIPFEQLSVAQQQEVLHWFSRDEYFHLQQALRLHNAQPISRKNEIRTALLSAFDKKQQHKTVELRLTILRAWQIAAAILMVMLFGSSYLWMRSGKKNAVADIIHTRDTVYLDSGDKQTERVYDTIYLVREEKRADANQTYRRKEKISPAVIPQVSDVNIRGIHEIDAIPNRLKRNSIKDDTLMNHYSFVTL